MKGSVRVWLIVLLAVTIAAGSGIAWWISQNNPVLPEDAPAVSELVPASFTLTAIKKDAAGIDPTSGFMLSASEELTEEQIKSLVLFTPSITYSVKKVSPSTASRSIVYAASVDELTYSYELQPTEPLVPDMVYQAAIAESNASDRDYGWAFQVKAPFQIMQTLPRDKATGVPLNTGIEITFNREQLVTPELFISFDPEIKGTFEVHGPSVVFIPKDPLAPKSVYAVTVKGGLATEAGTDTLAEGRTFKFETDTDEKDEAPALYTDFERDFMQLGLGDSQLFRIWSNGQSTASEVPLTVYQFPDMDAFLQSYTESRDWDLIWTAWQNNTQETQILPANVQKVLTHGVNIQNTSYESLEVKLPQKLEEGYYLLDLAESEKSHKRAWVQVSGTGSYYSFLSGHGVVWSYEFPGQKPLAGAEISFIDGNNKKSKIGTTDANGLAQVTTPAVLMQEENDNDRPYRPTFITIAPEGHLATVSMLTGGYRFGPSNPNRYWEFFSTDRSSYRVTDSVKFWAVVKGRKESLREQKVQVGIYSDYGFYYGGIASDSYPLVETEVSVSPFDTIQGELNFSGISPGYYAVVLSQGKDIISMTNIQIFGFVKPAYQLSITSSANQIYTGDTVTFEISGSFFDGTPVPGLEVNYNGYFDDPIEGTVKLDAQGKGSFSYTPKYASDKGYYPRDLSVEITPKLAEEGNIWARASVLVFGPEIIINVQDKPNKAEHEFTVKLNKVELQNGSVDIYADYVGDPVPNQQVLASIIKITHPKTKTGEYYDPITKQVHDQFEYGTKEETIEEIPGTTDEKGEWKLTKTFPSEIDTEYRVQFTGIDGKQRKYEASMYVWNGWISYGDQQDPYVLSLQREDGEGYGGTYKIGDSIDLKLALPATTKLDTPTILLYRYQNDLESVKILDTFEYRDTFAESSVPSVSYRAVLLTPEGFRESNDYTAMYSTDEKKLDIVLAPDKKEYRPGETVTLNVSVTDAAKKPVTAEVNIAAVDEALFHIGEIYYPIDVLSGLYKPIYVMPLSGTTGMDTPLMAGGAEKGGCFVGGTQVLMSDGSQKPIEEVMVGEAVLALDERLSPVHAIVQGTSRHMVREYLVLNGTLGVTPEHRLWVNGSWKMAGMVQKGDILRLDNGADEPVQSIERIRKPITVYNIVVGSYHTYFADGYYVHNEEKGGAPRSNFVDVALYQSEHTDASGIAKVTFKAPDNLTSWRVTALAFAPDTISAGQQSVSVPVTLPFFVDAVMSEMYLTGDKPELIVRSFGTKYDKAKPVQYTVTNPALKLDYKQEASDVVTVPMDSLPKGDLAFTIGASQGELKDAIVKKISVVESYFRAIEKSSYAVDDSLKGTAISGNATNATELIFTDEGRAKWYPDLANVTYQGGLRVEQHVASYVGRTLMEKYFDEPKSEEQIDITPYVTPEGGISILPYSDTDLAVSALVADIAPDLTFKQQLIGYFNSSMTDSKADLDRVSVALYGLASLGEPVLTRLQILAAREDLTQTAGLSVALGLEKLGDQEGARRLYEVLVKPRIRIRETQYALADSNPTTAVKLTDQAAMLAARIGFAEDASHFWEYLVSHYPERDLDLIERLLFIQSQIEQAEKTEASFTYKTAEREENVTLTNGIGKYVTMQPGELASLTFSNVKGKVQLVTTYERSKNPDELKTTNAMSIKRTYLVNGKPTNAFKDGDLVMVRLEPSFTGDAIDTSYQIVDYLPSGLRPITRIYERGLDAGTDCNPLWYPTRVEGTVSYFYTWKDFPIYDKCPSRTLNYYARVVSKGSYRANPALLQSLQDPKTIALSEEATVTVE